MTPGCTALAVFSVPYKALGQGAREEKIGELGLPVGGPRLVVLLEGHVVELDAATRGHLMRRAREHHDAACLAELVQQPRDEDEVTDSGW